MHLLFVHQAYPAQFGPFAHRLAATPGYRCTFVNSVREGRDRGVECVRFVRDEIPDDRAGPAGHRFQQAVINAEAVYRALAARPDIQPDVIVGHAGFGAAEHLRDLYPHVLIINHFEYFFRSSGAELDFRPDFPPTVADRQRNRCRNAMTLIALDEADRGYCPTEWQRSRFPIEYQTKLRTIFDGVDTDLWQPDGMAHRAIEESPIPPGTKVVTYAARGFESMRGFDIFMTAADIVCRRRSDVLFVVAGEDREFYGRDRNFTGTQSFKEWVLSKRAYDLSRFVFPGAIPEAALAKLLAATDCHVYWTVPYVLSWSLFNALACGATVVASDTEPVREVVRHGHNGLLVPFYEPERLADEIVRVLDDRNGERLLGVRGVQTIRERYSVDTCLPRFLSLCLGI